MRTFQIRGSKYDMDASILAMGYKETEKPTLERKYFKKTLPNGLVLEVQRPYSVTKEESLLTCTPYSCHCRLDNSRSIEWSGFEFEKTISMIDLAEREAVLFYNYLKK